MKIIVTKENLALALNKTTRAASARSAAMPIYANVLLEADQDKLTLTATDSEITIKTWIPALVEEAGATTACQEVPTDYWCVAICRHYH